MWKLSIGHFHSSYYVLTSLSGSWWERWYGFFVTICPLILQVAFPVIPDCIFQILQIVFQSLKSLMWSMRWQFSLTMIWKLTFETRYMPTSWTMDKSCEFDHWHEHEFTCMYNSYVCMHTYYVCVITQQLGNWDCVWQQWVHVTLCSLVILKSWNRTHCVTLAGC